MSKITSQQSSNGELQSKSQSGAYKHHNRPMKSNITNRMRTRRSEVDAPGDAQDEDAEGDGSANEEHNGGSEDPDVTALPGAQRQDGGETGQRLAGHKARQQDTIEANDLMNDDQAVGGAGEGAELFNGDDYGDVENISEESEDSEEDSDEVLHAAEQDLRDEFTLIEERRLAQRLGLHMSREPENFVDEFGMPINLDSDPFYGLKRDDSMYFSMVAEAEQGVWGMPQTFRSRENSDPASTAPKRVRFEEVEVDVDDSSGSDSEDPNDAYPDLLDAAEVPGLKNMIAQGVERDAKFDPSDLSDVESVYDFEADERLAIQLDEVSDSDDDMSSDESDDDGGATTDEESDEQLIARMKAMRQASGRVVKEPQQQKLVIRSVSQAPSTPSTSRPTTPKGSARGLKLSTVALDPTRPSMTTESDGTRIKIIPPATPLEKDKAFWDRAKTANSSRDGSPRTSFIARSARRADTTPMRPFTTESTLGSLFQGNLEFLQNNDSAGIIDDATIHQYMSTQTSFISTSTVADSDTDFREDINMQDFIDINGSGSETDDQHTGAATPATDANWFDTDTRSSTLDRRGSDLMDHFDQCRGVVGSFRYNQHQAKHVSSLALHPARRAATHEYNALQKGRRGAANTPITPARKKRISQDINPVSAGILKSWGNPLSPRRPRSRGNSLGGINVNGLYQTLADNPFDQA